MTLYSFFHCQSSIESISQRGLRDTGLSGPVCEAHGPSVNGEPLIEARVSNLLILRRPAAVTRVVISVVVNTVKRMFLWARTHIGDKGLIGAPSFADGYTASSIAWKVSGVWVSAPLMHSGPDSVLAPSVATGGRSVRGVPDHKHFSVSAPATGSKAIGEISGRGLMCLPAGAVTEPVNRTLMDAIYAHDAKATERHSSDVESWSPRAPRLAREVAVK
jgi:hypothetical protein